MCNLYINSLNDCRIIKELCYGGVAVAQGVVQA